MISRPNWNMKSYYITIFSIKNLLKISNGWQWQRTKIPAYKASRRFSQPKNTYVAKNCWFRGGLLLRSEEIVCLTFFEGNRDTIWFFLPSAGVKNHIKNSARKKIKWRLFKFSLSIGRKIGEISTYKNTRNHV